MDDSTRELVDANSTNWIPPLPLVPLLIVV